MVDSSFYISDEISVNLWRKIRHNEPPINEHGTAIGMSHQGRVRFAEDCSRLASQPLSVATVAETDTALQKGVISPPQRKKGERSTRAIQRSRKTRKNLSPWTELVGVKLSLPDDPVLLQLKGDANEKRPLRLILHVL